ncbi:hypothetical protein ZYGR_0AS03670 [Zygosaccharomyces rouxii]|uniref:Pre-mRNA-splicing factor CWC21 n=1 Tax=Zygosaccharomyces rouxii TaxID=4956 RepID=A0A1Q3AH24_ZYGRO|nr:hypothetical protein ZYGR_0AS03670 [Zygosaccharomyces rouxii]
MSYNNVGLKTAKGSSTSGHIQRSLASHDGSNQNYNRRNQRVERPRTREPVGHKPKDSRLVDHLQRREIELQVSDLRDQLEDGSDDDETIDQKCNELREKLSNTRKTTYTSRKEREQESTS